MDKRAIFNISYGLYILTAKEGEKDNGCIINTAIQVTENPLRVAITVNKGNYTHDMIMRTAKFNVSMLTEDTTFDTIKRFGFASGRDTDKTVGASGLMRADNGIIYATEGVNAYISCEVVNTVDLITHTMFIADVADAEVLSSGKSLTYEYYRNNIKPKPQASGNTSVYVCTICGYEYKGETIPDDYICPICKHGREYFEKKQ